MPRAETKQFDYLGKVVRRAVMREYRKMAKTAQSEQELEDMTASAIRALEQAIPKAIEAGAAPMLRQIEEQAVDVLRSHRKYQSGFERRLRTKWGKALDRLEMLLLTSHELGRGHLAAGVAAHDQSALFSALVPLHARSCRIAGEILCLLKAGYADGAHARWGTLHEVAVVTAFIIESGELVAERFLLHDAIRACKSAELLQKNAAALGWEPLPEDELVRLLTAREELCNRFGTSFNSDFGWAAEALGKPNPGIADVEAAVKLTRWRPIYRWASDGVHAGPGGLRSMVSKYGWQGVLAGPANVGLADPGQNTAISLAIVNSVLAKYQPTVDNLVMLRGFIGLVSQCQAAFIDASSAMDRLHEQHVNRQRRREDLNAQRAAKRHR